MTRNDGTIGKKSVLLAALAVTGIGTAYSSAAATYTWTGSGSGSNTDDWSAKQNWGNSSTPVAQDTAIFKTIGSGSTTPNIDVGGQAVGIMTFDASGVGATSYTLTRSSTNVLTLNNGASSAQINVTAADTATHVISTPLSLASNLALSNASSTALLTISGAISGAGMSLTKTGVGTVILSGANTYTGGTTVSGGTLSLDTTGSLANTGNVTVNGGTLQVNAVQQTVNQFSMSSGGLSLSLSNDTAGKVSATAGGSVTGGTITVAASGTQTLGRYTLVSGLSSTATGYTSSGAPTNYRVLAVGNEIDLVHKATIGTISVNPVANVIVGGSTTVSGSVANTAIANSSDLSFGVSGSSAAGTFGTPVTGTAAAGSTGAFSGLTFTGTTVGAGQSATLTVSDSNATNSPQTQGVTVNVYDHSSPTLTPSANFGTVITGATVADQVATLSNAGGFRAGLAVTSTGGLARTGSGLIAAGGSDTLKASVSTGTVGVYSQTYTVKTGDDTSMAGATANADKTFTVTGDVLGHAAPGFTGNTIGGTVNVIQGAAVSQHVTLTNGTAGAHIAGLSIDAVSMLTGASAGDVLAAGGSKTLTANLNTGTLGSSTQNFSVSLFDDHAYNGKGAASLGTQSYSTTVNVYGHGDAKFATVTQPNDPPHDPYPTDYAHNLTTADPILSGDGKTLCIDFKTIWAQPGDSPYPVYYYFDITNPLSTSVTMALDGPVGFSVLTSPTGGETWSLTDANGNAFNPTLAGGGVYHARISFDTNDPSLFLPNDPFSAKWTLHFLEDQSVIGASTEDQTLTIKARAIAIPLPASALMGLGLLSCLGVKQFARARRLRVEHQG